MANDPECSSLGRREDWPWDEMEMMLEHMFGKSRARLRPTWRPAIDLVEEEDAFLVMIELPGVEPSDVELTVRGRILTIRGERTLTDALVGTRVLVMERCHGLFERRVALPSPVAPQHLEADYRDGVLFVRILKQGES